MRSRPLAAWMLAGLLGPAALGGCASVAPVGPQPYVIANGVTYDELAAQLRAGRPQSAMIAAIRQRGMHHAPQAADLDALTAAGASQDLIDAIIIATWQPDSRRLAYNRYPGYYGYPGYAGYPGYLFGPSFGIGAWYPWPRHTGTHGPSHHLPHSGHLPDMSGGSPPSFGGGAHGLPRPPQPRRPFR